MMMKRIGTGVYPQPVPDTYRDLVAGTKDAADNRAVFYQMNGVVAPKRRR